MVRMTRAQVNRILAYEPKLFPEAPQCPCLPPQVQDMINATFAEAAATMAASHASCLKEKEWVRKQIEAKGYAEYEVDAYAPRRPRVGGISVTQLPRHPVKHAVGLGVRKTF